MKAWAIDRFGAENLAVVERPTPSPGRGELLVRVRAVSLNYRDRLVVSGAAIPKLSLPKPGETMLVEGTGGVSVCALPAVSSLYLDSSNSAARS